MAEKIVEQVKEIIKSEPIKMNGNEKARQQFERLLEANEMYKEMVAKGLIKPKGYDLRSPLDPMTEEERKNLLRLKDAYSPIIQNQR